MGGGRLGCLRGIAESCKSLENLSHKFALLGGVARRVAIVGNGLGQADAEETVCNWDGPLPPCNPSICQLGKNLGLSAHSAPHTQTSAEPGCPRGIRD